MDTLLTALTVPSAALPTVGIGLAFLGGLLLCAVIDIRRRIIPNRIVGALIGLWALWRFLLILSGEDTGSILLGSAGSLFAMLMVGSLLFGFALLYERLTGVAAFGGGDVKLTAAMVLFIGWSWTLVCLFIACLVSLLYGLALRKSERGIPFAPCLLCGAWAVIVLL